MAKQSFLERKGIKLSPKTYFVDAMGGMAQGLFASLLIGTILKTIADKIAPLNIDFFNVLADLFHQIASDTSASAATGAGLTGAAIGVGIAYALNAPMLVTVCSAIVGYFANNYCGAGPLGAFVAVIISCELGKLVSKSTKIDILVTPIVSLMSGYAVSYFVCPYIAIATKYIGEFINTATTMHPFVMGVIISVVVGIILTLPISSAAICASIGISGIAGGAALAGCCAQMVGFAVASFRENKWGGIVSQGIGTSMLQMPNIVRHPQIWLPATLAAAITGPVSTLVFSLECNGVSAGMGTCGFVGPIGAVSAMTESGTLDATAWIGLALVCFVLPALLSLAISEAMRKLGMIKYGYMELD